MKSMLGVFVLSAALSGAFALDSCAARADDSEKCSVMNADLMDHKNMEKWSNQIDEDLLFGDSVVFKKGYPVLKDYINQDTVNYMRVSVFYLCLTNPELDYPYVVSSVYHNTYVRKTGMDYRK